MIVKRFNYMHETICDRHVDHPVIKQEINGNDTFEFVDREAGFWQKNDYVFFKHEGILYEYMVVRVEEDALNGATIYAENSIVELRSKILELNSDGPMFYGVNSWKEFVKDTNWHIDERNFIQEGQMAEYPDVITAYDLIREQINNGNGELQTTITTVAYAPESDTYDEVHREFAIKKHVGTDTGFRFEYRGRLKSVQRIYEDDEIYTAIYAIGSTVEHEDDGKPIDPDVVRAQEEAARKAKEEARLNEETHPSPKTYRITANAVNIRAGAGTEFGKVGLLKKGDEVVVAAKKKVGSYTWGRIDKTNNYFRLSYAEEVKEKTLTERERLAEREKQEAERQKREESKAPLTLTYDKGTPLVLDEEATGKYGIRVNDAILPRVGIFKYNTTNVKDLEQQALATLQEYKVPRVRYECDVFEARLEMLRLGDSVIVIDDELDLRLKARVISQVIYPDEKTRKITIGNVTLKNKPIGSAIRAAVERAKSNLVDMMGRENLKMANMLMNGAGNFITYDSEEPIDPRPGDIWYRINEDDTVDILIWDGEKWELRMWDSFTSELEGQVDYVAKQADDAVQATREFIQQIDTDISNAGFSSIGEAFTSIQDDAKTALQKASDENIKKVIATENYVTEGEINTKFSSLDVSGEVSEYLQNHEVVTPERFKRLLSETEIDDNGNTVTGQLASIEMMATGIQTVVSDMGNDMSSRITQLDNAIQTKVSSADVESRITQAQNQITLSVQQDIKDEVGAMLLQMPDPNEIHPIVEKMSDESSEKSWASSDPSRYWKYFANSVAYIDGGTNTMGWRGPVGLEDAIKTTHPDLSWTSIMIAAGVVRVDVKSETDITQTWQGELGTYVRRSTGATTWGPWEPLITKEGLMAGINIEAGGVTIFNGDNKLNVTPETTYIQNATISSAMIKNGAIGTAQIGTIDASAANIVNITANNLSSNKAQFIQALFNGINTFIEITGDAIKFVPYNYSNQFITEINANGLDFLRGGSSKIRTLTVKNITNSSGSLMGAMIALTSRSHSFFIGMPDPDYYSGKYGDEAGTLKVNHFITVVDMTASGVWTFHYKVNMRATLDMGGYSITNQSDIRLKNVIGEWDVSATDIIDDIDFIRFTWKEREGQNIDTDTIQYGLSAQSAPFIAVEDDDGYLSIDQTKLLMTVAKSVQELNNRLKALEKENEQLKSLLKQKGLEV